MQLLAIDIGGTNVKLGLVDEQGQVSHQTHFPTLMHELETFESRLLNHLEIYATKPFKGIAISCTGLASQENLTIGDGNPILEAFGKTMPQLLMNQFKLPISVENDGNCSILAEHWLGAAKGYQNVISIVIGTSIGGAIMINNQLYKGNHLLAGEFGYSLFKQPNQQWEIWSIVGSTQGMVNQFNHHTSGIEIFHQYHQGNPEAIQVVYEFVEKLAVQCYNLQYILDPDVILIGGGVSEEPALIPLVENKIKEIIEKIPSNVIIPKIARCHFGNNANLIGASKHWLNIYGKNKGE
ncbi:ROK family protein [Globicatella sp. PHS-GS-PNBC-21-1553]|uniref:ROK family protein n=1 Tax=Globicatella sp. PHS-GS-PNBC-21-1553 TaxID=2885764 RepID=UPI00298F13A7|nr:ROK family protein [Globicatella sp. PHS-GS-PNBC-21-1553]WPC09052.1 ROK family protein [Globicatella sp. PHS-GS-PNBC-21-1553]